MSEELVEENEDAVQESSSDEDTQQSDPKQAEESTSNIPSVPDFSELKKQQGESNSSTSADINRLHDVKVTVSAELGRTSVPIHELLKLTEGSVLELHRGIECPVELVAQGVPLANGEVVVVDNNFAIRIQEVYSKS